MQAIKEEILNSYYSRLSFKREIKSALVNSDPSRALVLRDVSGSALVLCLNISRSTEGHVFLNTLVIASNTMMLPQANH